MHQQDTKEASGPRLRSAFNPEMVRLFHESPKPQQITWGVGFPHGEKVQCLDVVSCRQNALLHHEGRLPAFAFADEPQPYLDTDGAPQFPIGHYDFYFVDKGKVLEEVGEACGCEARADCELCGGCGLPPARLEHLPYDGAHLYPQLALRYMLEIGVVGHADVKYGIRASEGILPEELRTGFDAVKAAVAATFPHEKERDLERRHKLNLLSCIGLWGRTNLEEWVVRETTCDDDMCRITLKSYKGEGLDLPLSKVKTEVVVTHSYLPLNLIALHQEAVWMHRAWRASRPARVYGALVDCLFHDSPELERAIAQVRMPVVQRGMLPHTRVVFRTKLEDGLKVPANPQRYRDGDIVGPQALQWVSVDGDGRRQGGPHARGRRGPGGLRLPGRRGQEPQPPGPHQLLRCAPDRRTLSTSWRRWWSTTRAASSWAAPAPASPSSGPRWRRSGGRPSRRPASSAARPLTSPPS